LCNEPIPAHNTALTGYTGYLGKGSKQKLPESYKGGVTRKAPPSKLPMHPAAKVPITLAQPLKAPTLLIYLYLSTTAKLA